MVDINLKDPAVQRLMGRSAVEPAAGGKQVRELVQIAGDAPDPTGRGPAGAQTTYRMNQSAFAHPRIWYRDRYLTADAYRLPGEPLKIHILCPRCSTPQKPHGLMIASDRKHIDLDMERPVRAELLARIMVSVEDAEKMGLNAEQATYRERAIAAAQGTLNIEQIVCPWELPEVGKHDASAIVSGANMCRWRVVIENNVARDD